MMGGLGLGALGASHVWHTRDGERRGTRGWCKPRGLEVVGCDVRREGKSRGRQGGEPGARGRTVTGPLPQIGRYHATSRLDRLVPAGAKLLPRAPGARGAYAFATIAFELSPTHLGDVVQVPAVTAGADGGRGIPKRGSRRARPDIVSPFRG